MSFQANVNVCICGIPAIAKVTHLIVVKGSVRADNPDDYYGYSEVEFEICDRKGYAANWLERKMTDEDWDSVEEQIWDWYREA